MIGLESKPECIPVPDDGEDDLSEESPEEILRRLDEEKQDWKAQLAKMKATLEAQDRRIEEDRAKLREVLKEEEKTQVVPVNKAPTRRVVKLNNPGSLTTSKVRIPAITEHARTVWPSIQEFHNMRARTIAKAVPFGALNPELYLQSYGVTSPPRYLNPGYPAGYPAALTAHNSQEFTVDGMGRVVRPARVLGITGGSSSTNIPISGTSRSRILNSALSPSSGQLRPSTVRTMGNVASSIAGSTSVVMPSTTSGAQSQQTTGGWFTSMFGSTPPSPVAQASPPAAAYYRYG